MIKNKNSGFSIVETFIVLFVVCLVGGSFWLVRLHSKPKTKQISAQVFNPVPSTSSVHLNIAEMDVKLNPTRSMEELGYKQYQQLSLARATAADRALFGDYSGSYEMAVLTLPPSLINRLCNEQYPNNVFVDQTTGDIN